MTRELAEPRMLDLVVEHTAALTPMLRRLRLTGADLGDFRYEPGQDLMLAVPLGDGQTINRRYTIRRFDPVSSTVDLDVVGHGNGPGAHWARTARPGSPVVAMGPRGKVVPVDTATWHLFACDESGWAATAAMVESLGSDRTALVFAEIAGPDEVQALATEAVVHLEWLERGSHRPGEPEALLGAIEKAPLPDGAGHAYLSAELAVVRAIADGLSRRGLPPEQISAKAYWRLGAANHAYGEPPRDRA